MSQLKLLARPCNWTPHGEAVLQKVIVSFLYDLLNFFSMSA